MGAKVSGTGITQFAYGTAPTDRSTANAEAITSLGDTQAGVVVRNSDFPRPSIPGRSTVAGATRLKGGRGGA